MQLKSPTHIVLHTAAAGTTKAIDQSAATIRAYHVKTKGWSDIGYHFVVRFDGDVEEGRPLNQVGAHVEGFNSQSVGICFAGHGDLQDFTPEQKKAGVTLVCQMLEHFELTQAFIKNPMRVIGHREINQLIDTGVAKNAPKTTKTCPGKKVDMSAFRKAVLAELV